MKRLWVSAAIMLTLLCGVLPDVLDDPVVGVESAKVGRSASRAR